MMTRWQQGEWNHLMHRRCFDEFTQTGECRNYQLGEWFTTQLNLHGAHRMGIGERVAELVVLAPVIDHNVNIVRWNVPIPWVEVGPYESGYADGWFDHPMNIELRDYISRVDYRIYLQGMRDGRGDRLARIFDL